MRSIVPRKLATGSHIRVIAPALSLSVVASEQKDLAEKRLRALGLSVSYGVHVSERDSFESSSIESRIADLHAAFSDESVDAVLTVVGGFNSNQLLRYIDFELIGRNPKIFCGFSDITALSTAIYAKTGLVTYSGPTFSSFGMLEGFDYTQKCFCGCLMQAEALKLPVAEKWSDDLWYLSQSARTFAEGEGLVIVNEGEASGTLMGGNLCTLNLLQGTEFLPSLKDSVLFIEDDHESKAGNFDRDLQSLLHLEGSGSIRGLVIGRFQNASGISIETLRKIIASKKELSHIPIIANADFGHTTPIFTFPVGGTVRISARGREASIELTKH